MTLHSDTVLEECNMLEALASSHTRSEQACTRRYYTALLLFHDFFDDCLKGNRMVHREVCEYFTIQDDGAILKFAHKHGIR